MGKRINWLDVSRGLTFLMVIYSHLDYCNPSIMKYFSPMFLTTFFFVSGYLFKENQSFSFVLEQRTRTLLLPMLTLGGVMITLSNILSFNEVIPLSDAIKGLLYQNGTNQMLWFIAALYVYSLGFYWIERFCKNERQLLFVSCILFLLNYLYHHALGGHGIPWHIDTIGYGCFYMGLGKVFKKYEYWFDEHLDRKMLWIVSIVYLALITILLRSFSYAGSKYLVDSFFGTILGILVCVYWSKTILNQNRFLLFVGANTLFYFAFHGKVYSLLQTLVAKVLVAGGIGHSFLLDNALGLVIVLLDALILIIPAMLVNRYLPWLLGKGFKLWNVKA
jgi:hypothetical protein